MTIVWNTIKVWDGNITQAAFNKLVDAVQSITLNPGLNYNIKRSPAGTTLVTNGKGAEAETCPFTVTLTPVSGDPTSLTVNVTPGTVNQFIATNVLDTFTISHSGTYYVKAGVETDGQNVTSFTISVDTDAPETQNATASSLPTSFDVVLALIKNGVAYRTLSCGSIILTPVQAFITDTGGPVEPGELTYIPYYVWQMSVA